MRNKRNINKGWYFKKTDVLPVTLPEDWEMVALPHTWNAIDGQDGGNDYYRGTCMYARGLRKPRLAPGGRVVLEFLGAAMTAEVFLNGVKLARHEDGYSTFRVDITEQLLEENLLCVSVDNSANEKVYPQKADFTFYGGIYRDVNLITVSAEHFELLKDGTSGIRVTPRVEKISHLDVSSSASRECRAVIEIETWQNAEGIVRYTIYAPEPETGRMRMAGQAETVSADGYAKAEILLEQVRLWDGINDPYLYTAEAELIPDTVGNEKTENKVKDVIQSKFGCRTFSFDKEQGFFLNGRSYPLRGVSRHQDRAGVGNALTPEMHREDMELIREIGANTVRLAHYQHAQEFYDLCDEYGMIVWAEIPYITKHMSGGRENTLCQMRELVTQCYNHPSIVCWGLSNEITASGSVTEDMLTNHELLNDLCHRMDKTRPTSMAHVFMLEMDSPLIDISDIGSYNLYFGWYLGDLKQNDTFFDEYHEKFPERVIGFSEYGADANIRFQTAAPERGDYSEQYQALYHEHILRCIEKRPYLWATHVWNMFDFAADGRDEGGAHGVNQKGLVTMDRKVKKDAFYLYKAAWSREPFVHLCGSRYVDRTESVTEIKAYSNQPAVTLWVDGKKLETKAADKVFLFEVPISHAHTIEAKAGSSSDAIQIRKTEVPNREYLFRKEEVVNWFDKDEVDPDCLSIQDTMGTVMDHPAGARILGRVMDRARAARGDVATSASGNANLQMMMRSMTVQSILKQAGDVIGPDQIRELNEALQQIKKEKM